MNGPHTAVVVFDGCKPTADLNRKLVRDIHQVGGWAALVEMTQLPGPFLLPPVPEPALPLLEILPIQMMTLALAKLRGMVAGQFHLGSKITSSE
jgi:glucosamine--fructose-6-phosphate aminotransferase (isomerizing)